MKKMVFLTAAVACAGFFSDHALGQELSPLEQLQQDYTKVYTLFQESKQTYDSDLCKLDPRSESYAKSRAKHDAFINRYVSDYNKHLKEFLSKEDAGDQDVLALSGGAFLEAAGALWAYHAYQKFNVSHELGEAIEKLVWRQGRSAEEISELDGFLLKERDRIAENFLMNNATQADRQNSQFRVRQIRVNELKTSAGEHLQFRVRVPVIRELKNSTGEGITKVVVDKAFTVEGQSIKGFVVEVRNPTQNGLTSPWKRVSTEIIKDFKTVGKVIVEHAGLTVEKRVVLLDTLHQLRVERAGGSLMSRMSYLLRWGPKNGSTSTRMIFRRAPVLLLLGGLGLVGYAVIHPESELEKTIAALSQCRTQAQAGCAARILGTVKSCEVRRQILKAVNLAWKAEAEHIFSEIVELRKQ